MSHLARRVPKEKIPIWKRIGIRLASLFGIYGFKAFRVRTKNGILDYYYGYCKLHGYFVNYPRGFMELLYCPECDK